MKTSKSRVAYMIVLIALFLFLSISLTFGLGSIIGTIALYVVLGWIIRTAGTRLAGMFKLRDSVAANLKLAGTSLLLTCFIAELILRYGIMTYASYSEKNGGFFYVSPYLVKERSWSSIWKKDMHVYQANLSEQYSFEEYDYALNTNSLGLRNEEIMTEKSMGVYRIIALGDSFTEGRGAAEDESWPVVLNSRLKVAFTNRTFEVINAGISGSDPFFELHLLKNKLLELHPDMVIMAVNSSDIDDVVIRGGAERFDNNGELNYKNGPWWVGLYANSYVFRHIIHDIFEYNLLLNKTSAQSAIRESAKKSIHEAINLFIEMANGQGFRPMVVFHPLASEFDTGETELDQIFERVRQDSNVLALNIMKNLGASHSDGDDLLERFYWAIDQHHTPAGYSMMADEICSAMDKAKFFK